MFIMYTTPLYDIIESHGVSSMLYADDTQLYVSFKPGEIQEYVHKIQCCISDVKKWASSNNLKLNESKTEVIHITSRFRKRLELPTLTIDNITIPPTEKVKNLGVVFDQNMVMDKFVSQKCKTASFALYKIGKIRQYLDTSTAKNLVQALILCHLDYCNSLLFNIPDSQISKLQLIQNSAARLITGLRKHTHITPVLDQLHWLPVQVRINFKILLLTFQCIHNMAPIYLKELIVQYVPSRNLRSSNKYILQYPKLSTKYYGDRVLSFATASLWNTLPNNVKEASSVIAFKGLLKTHLFQQYFVK